MTEQNKEPNIADQQRIVIALGIVATEIAIQALSSSHATISSIIGGLFLLPAVFSFFFIVFTGANLKFRRAGDIGEVAIPDKLRQWCYDLSLDAYWWALILVVLVFVALLFGWNGSPSTFLSYWPSYFISVGILGTIVVITEIISGKTLKVKSKKLASKKTARKRS